MSEKYIVVGGGAAGMSAASRIRRIKKEAEITVFEKGGYVSHAPCGIPYYIEDLIPKSEDLVFYTPEFFREKRGISVLLYTEVKRVDVEEKEVQVSNGKSTKKYSWDKLILATGASPFIPPIKGTDLKGIYTLHLIEDGVRFKKVLKKSKTVAVVGGGYIGLEVTEAICRKEKRVILFEMMPHVLPATFDDDTAKIIQEEVRKNKVELHLNEKVTEFQGKESVEKVLTEKGEYPVDVVLLSAGVKPNIKLAKEAGLEIGSTGAVKVNKKMETNVAGVYAAGDIAETTNLVTGKKTWVPLAPTANKMGFVAATNAAGGYLEFPGVTGTAITKVFNLFAGRTGLTEKEAKKEGFNVASVMIEAKTKAHYYPNRKPIYVKLVGDMDSKRVLGAQVIGSEEVLGRINVVSLLISNGGTVKDLIFTDLGYAPPTSPVWDPLIIAARVLSRKISL